MITRYRPTTPVLALPHSDFVARQLTIDRGVEVLAVLPDLPSNTNDIQALMQMSVAEVPEDLKGVVFTCGTPLGRVGTTNLLQRWDPATRAVLAET